MRIAFRTDASEEVGLGHLSRCLNLADALADLGASAVFIGRFCDGAAAEVALRAHDVIPLAEGVLSSEDDAAATIAALGNSIEWVVVDHYGLGVAWERQVRAVARHILVIDDRCRREHDCDVFLNQNLTTEEWPTSLEHPLRLMGPRYALLSREFESVSPRHAASSTPRLLVSFGGSDPTNETAKALEALREVGSSSLNVDVFVGKANPRASALAPAVQRVENARLHVGVRNLATHMQQADLAIGAGGTTTWERCRVGLPSIIIATATNQEAVAHAVGCAGAGLYLGRHSDVSASMIASAVRVCLQSPGLMTHLAARAESVVDGAGTRRVAALLVAHPVTLRRATAADCDMVFVWRNDEEVRRRSRDSRPLNRVEHGNWFASAIMDPNRVVLIAASPSRALGVIRYDLHNETAAAVSIYLAPGLAGHGLGSTVLRQGTQWLQVHYPHIQSIVAEILPDNAASRRAFARALFAEQLVTMVRSLRFDSKENPA